jgi:hypothetical protein
MGTRTLVRRKNTHETAFDWKEGHPGASDINMLGSTIRQPKKVIPTSTMVNIAFVSDRTMDRRWRRRQAYEREIPARKTPKIKTIMPITVNNSTGTTLDGTAFSGTGLDEPGLKKIFERMMAACNAPPRTPPPTRE